MGVIESWSHEVTVWQTAWDSEQAAKDFAYAYRRVLEVRFRGDVPEDAAGDDVTVVLTRDGDRHVELDERTAIANHNRADLFVSIHADAFRDKRVRGSSVYVLSQRGASSEAARWLAERENAADLVGGVSLEDKDPLLASVLLVFIFMLMIFVVAQFFLADLARSRFGAIDRGRRPARSRVAVRGSRRPGRLVDRRAAATSA